MLFIQKTSMFKYEDVNSNAIHELGHTRPHSNHFFTLFLDNKIVIEPSEFMIEWKEEEKYVNILTFVVSKSKNYIPHLLLYSFIFILPPFEHSKKLEEVRFAIHEFKVKDKKEHKSTSSVTSYFFYLFL